ncbi:hypothetical protein CALCODRAFT_427455 [Calocera cornea HHB12733]|uniref:Uncharacterized protein n=1 Tax=Calocera cornea HHB12733 TaxID=1353952 RepID=A0A165JE03_9BASI|nr:hypothetical protein CALCODRAFT_427455 [Calocera cornea HHB12733]
MERKQTEEKLKNCQYNCALDALESLVVQHLFELEKFNLHGTGAHSLLPM